MDVSPTSAEIHVGAEFEFTATPRDEEGRELNGWVIAWSSSDEAVATVTQDGRVTGRSTGAASITATIDGHEATAEAIVTFVPVASIEISHGSRHMEVGETFQLTATPRDANGHALEREVTWTSPDESVATVDSEGLVTGRSPGRVWIRVESEGKQATSAVTVRKPRKP